MLVLFSGPQDSPSGGVPDDADLLVTVRASTLRHHAGQAAFPGGATDPGDAGPVSTALREAREETGIDTTRLHPLATLERDVHRAVRLPRRPGARLLAGSRPGGRRRRDPKPRSWRGYRCARSSIRRTGSWCTARHSADRFAGPAFLLNEMLVWGFTGQVISAMLDVAGWAQPWNTEDVRELDDAMALVGDEDSYGEAQ